MNKLSEDERIKRWWGVRQAVASSTMEGYTLTPRDELLNEQSIDGIITPEQYYAGVTAQESNIEEGV